MLFTELDLLKEVTYVCGSELTRLRSRPESQANRGNSVQVLLLLNPIQEEKTRGTSVRGEIIYYNVKFD